MSPLLKNIAAGLIVLTLAFVGYYLYSQNKNASLSFEENSDSTQEILISTQIFIERSAMLDKVKLETEVLTNPLFISYRSFSSPINPQNVGRSNPFSEISISNF